MRLPDALLDACLCDPHAPLASDPARLLLADKAAAKAQLAELGPWLNERQRMLHAHRQDAVLLVLQGPDCAGKDGVIRRVLGHIDPQGVQISSFQAPDAQERGSDFLARYHRRLPEPGRIGVFNRSYYEALVSDPLDGYCTTAEIPARLQAVQAFEAQLQPRRIHLLKCYLQLSAAEQRNRLLRRLELPSKRWKLSPADLDAHRRFDELQQHWAQMLGASHAPQSPWYVIPADHRWQRDLILASLLARVLESLVQDWPQTPAPFAAEDLR